MGVRLDDDEAWERVSAAHTGILTTLRRDGRPVPLPVWFAVVDRAIYVSTVATTTKVGRVRRDRRAAFLVESGRAWRELSAVLLHVDVTEVTDAGERERGQQAIDAKYAAHRSARGAVPERTAAHYAQPRVVLRLDIVEAPVSWDNARIPVAAGAAQERAHP